MLRVEFQREHDGAFVFRCLRADGTSTWQKHVGKNALFFPFHDLTHFVVESVLGFRQGFYGLINAGWDVADTGGKGARGALPAEAVLVEHIVGLVDRERVGGAPPLTADEFNTLLADLARSDRIVTPPLLSDSDLHLIRSERNRLYEALAALQPGAVLRLTFDEPSEPHT